MVLDYFSNSLDMHLVSIIICLSCYIMSSYVFCKSQSISLKTSQVAYLSIISVIITTLFVYARMLSYPLSQLLRFLLIPISFTFLNRERKDIFKTLVIGVISLSFVMIMEVIATAIQSTIIWITRIILNNVLANTIREVIALILCVCFLNIKRFRKGFQFFEKDNNLGLGLLVSSIVLLVKVINLRDNRDSDYYYIVASFGIIIAGFGLYLWISRSITAHYRDRLQLKSEEHYKELLEEKEEEIEKLNQSNAYLAKVVHRDNHLMSNLNTSIDMYFNSDDEAYKDNLLRELQILSNERGELINKEQLESKLLPSTGNLLIDSAIGNLYIKAAAHGIDFNLTVSSTVDEIIGKFISQTDLQTLLCDHIKDAIIAVESKGESGGKILVNLSNQNDNYCIDIYDNGVAFAPETLSKLGLERVTTHADSGGSGIGFMTTFETLKKAYASLIITEFENQIPFSKSVSFRFDVESSFIVHSYRKDELKELITRNDIIIVN